jgi:N-acetylglucosaminyl-diphospho-decaprenol L-rhamnosyltransferase
MKLSIVIVNFNVKDQLDACLSSIFRDKNLKDFEVIVVDNASGDNSIILKKKYPKINFIESKENLGFSKANNLGAQKAKGEYLLFLNPDTIIIQGSINKLLDFAKKTHNLGAVSPKLLNPDKSVQPSCHKLLTVKGAFAEFWLNQKGSFLKYIPPLDGPSKVDCAVGAALLMSRDVFRKVGGWDERYFMYLEDNELGRKIKSSGLDFWYLPDSEIIHLHGGSSSQDPILAWNRMRKSSKIYHGLTKYTLITLVIYLSQKLGIYKNTK